MRPEGLLEGEGDVTEGYGLPRVGLAAPGVSRGGGLPETKSRVRPKRCCAGSRASYCSSASAGRRGGGRAPEKARKTGRERSEEHRLGQAPGRVARDEASRESGAKVGRDGLGGGCIDPQSPIHRSSGLGSPTPPRDVGSRYRGAIADLSLMYRRCRVVVPPLSSGGWKGGGNPKGG